MKQLINKKVLEHKDRFIGFLRDIIAIPSMSGDEGAVIERMRQEMHDLGYDRVWTDSFGNLMGQVGSGSRIIAIDGHCDTVDVGNPGLWKVDPFRGDCRDGIIYGRGASDQKGGLASAIYAGRIIREAGIPPDISLIVVASVLEENIEGQNWQHIIEKENIIPDLVVLTEPTDLKICTGQRGRMDIKIRTEGVSCHGSAPERGENAIYKIAPVIMDVNRLNMQLPHDPLLGKGSVTVSDVRSTSPSYNAVADSATIHLDRRLIRGETDKTAVGELEALPSVRKAGAEVFIPEQEIKSYTGLVYKVKQYYPVWTMDDTDPVVKKAEDVYYEQFGEKAVIGIWNFSTNGVVTKGVYNIPTIGFGPGNEIYAHTPDDQISVVQLLKAVEFYSAFVLNIG